MKKIAQKLFAFLMLHKWLTAIATIILIIIGISIWRQSTKITQYTTDKVTRTTIVSEVSESGNIQTEGQANIASPIEGVVEQIFVKNGDFVYPNSPLFAVRSLATDQEKAAAQSAYLAAQSNTLMSEQNKKSLAAQITAAQKAFYDAQNNYNIIAKKFRHHEINPATQVSFKQLEVDSAKTAVTAAQENLDVLKQKYQDADQVIEAAHAAEDSAKLNLDGKTSLIVRAPSRGTVSNINLNSGDMVTPMVGSAQPNLIISRLKNLVFEAQINENEIAKLKIGQVAQITIDAIKNKVLKATVKDIDTIGTNTAGVVTFDVHFLLQEGDENLRSGMSGNVDVEVEKHENVLTVSSAAVKPYQDGMAVQVIDTTKPIKKGKLPELKYIPVKTGLKSTERTEILDGLTEGTEVIINNTGNQFKSNIFGG